MNPKNEIEVRKIEELGKNEKEEKIQKEYQKLRKIFEKASNEALELADGLLKETAYLKVELDYMRKILNETGMIKIHPQDVSKQKALPIANEYRSV